MCDDGWISLETEIERIISGLDVARPARELRQAVPGMKPELNRHILTAAAGVPSSAHHAARHSASAEPNGVAVDPQGRDRPTAALAVEGRAHNAAVRGTGVVLEFGKRGGDRSLPQFVWEENRQSQVHRLATEVSKTPRTAGLGNRMARKL